MKNQCKAILIGVLFFCIVGFLTACKTEKDPDLDTSTPQVASNLVNAVSQQINLAIADIPLDILEYLKSCATGELVEGNLIASKNITLISARIAKGIMSGLGVYQDGELSAQAGEDESIQSPHKKKAIEIMTRQLVASLGQSLKGDALSEAINGVFINILSSLQEAGIPAGDVESVSDAIINSAVHALSEIGIDDSTIIDLSIVMYKSAAAGIGNKANGFSIEEYKNALESSIVSVMVSLHEVEIENDDVIGRLEDIIQSAIKGVGEADIDPVYLLDLAKKVESGVMEGLQAIGVSNTDINANFSRIEAACDQSIQALIETYPEPVSRDSLVKLIYENLSQIDGSTDVVLADERRSQFKSDLVADTNQSGVANSANLNELMPVIIKSAEKTTGTFTPPLTDFEKLDVLADILESCEEFLIGRVSSENAIEVLENITQAVVDNLDLLNLSADHINDALEKISFGLVSPLGTIPLGDKSVGDAATAIVAKIVHHITQLGLGDSDKLGALASTVKGAVEGLGETGLNLDIYDETVAALAKIASAEAVANEIAAGKTGEDLFNATADISSEIIAAMVAAGLSTSSCSDVAADIVTGASSELSSVLNADDLTQALNSAVDGIKSGLEESGASPDEIADAEQSGMEASDEAVSNTATPTAPKLIISEEKLTTQEGSEENGSFKVSLDKSPAETVTVSISSKDTTEGTVLPTTLLITADNWNKPQTIAIKPVEDGFVDDEVSYSIVIETDSGIRKTLTAKNGDNDVVGISVTPTRKQYTSEAGGEAWYDVKLKSQPKDDIMLRWAITTGKNSVTIEQYREMPFSESDWNTTKLLKIKGKVCSDCEEHSSVMVETQNIISVNGTDPDYPKLSPESVSITNLKDGPVIRRTNILSGSNNIVKLTFNKNIFPTIDDAYIYETVFETETIEMTYVQYQSRPVLIKNSCTDTSGNIRTTVTSATVTDPNTQISTTTYSHTFCLSFYNATTTRTQSGMNGWYSGSVSCSGSGGSPNLVTCSFSGSGSTPGNNTIPANTVFNEQTGNSLIGLVFDTSPGPGASQTLPNIQAEPVQPTVTMKYKALTVEQNDPTAEFRSETALQSGYWFMTGLSKSLLKESNTYGTTRYYYIYVP